MKKKFILFSLLFTCVFTLIGIFVYYSLVNTNNQNVNLNDTLIVESQSSDFIKLTSRKYKQNGLESILVTATVEKYDFSTDFLVWNLVDANMNTISTNAISLDVSEDTLSCVFTQIDTFDEYIYCKVSSFLNSDVYALLKLGCYEKTTGLDFTLSYINSSNEEVVGYASLNKMGFSGESFNYLKDVYLNQGTIYRNKSDGTDKVQSVEYYYTFNVSDYIGTYMVEYHGLTSLTVEFGSFSVYTIGELISNAYAAMEYDYFLSLLSENPELFYNKSISLGTIDIVCAEYGESGLINSYQQSIELYGIQMLKDLNIKNISLSNNDIYF